MVAYSSVLRFWDEEKDYRGLDTTPYGEDDVCLPSYLFERDWPRELIEKSSYTMLVGSLNSLSDFIFNYQQRRQSQRTPCPLLSFRTTELRLDTTLEVV